MHRESPHAMRKRPRRSLIPQRRPEVDIVYFARRAITCSRHAQRSLPLAIVPKRIRSCRTRGSAPTLSGRSSTSRAPQELGWRVRSALTMTKRAAMHFLELISKVEGAWRSDQRDYHIYIAGRSIRP